MRPIGGAGRRRCAPLHKRLRCELVYKRGSSEFRTPDKPDAWYADRKTRITATAPTVERACAMLAEAVEQHESGLQPRPYEDD